MDPTLLEEKQEEVVAESSADGALQTLLRTHNSGAFPVPALPKSSSSSSSFMERQVHPTRRSIQIRRPEPQTTQTSGFPPSGSIPARETGMRGSYSTFEVLVFFGLFGVAIYTGYHMASDIATAYRYIGQSLNSNKIDI